MSSAVLSRTNHLCRHFTTLIIREDSTKDRYGIPPFVLIAARKSQHQQPASRVSSPCSSRAIGGRSSFVQIHICALTTQQAPSRLDKARMDDTGRTGITAIEEIFVAE
ncbi:hypothetical protein CF326_g7148 [Tilletia indica]|nr:hypothetical protein CF326_g7148 [Tilletia indica]